MSEMTILSEFKALSNLQLPYLASLLSRVLSGHLRTHLLDALTHMPLKLTDNSHSGAYLWLPPPPFLLVSIQSAISLLQVPGRLWGRAQVGLHALLGQKGLVLAHLTLGLYVVYAVPLSPMEFNSYQYSLPAWRLLCAPFYI